MKVIERKSKSALNKALVDRNMIKVLSPALSEYFPGSHSTLINSHCLFNLGHITRHGYLAATKKLTNTETVHNPGLFPLRQIYFLRFSRVITAALSTRAPDLKDDPDSLIIISS